MTLMVEAKIRGWIGCEGSGLLSFDHARVLLGVIDELRAEQTQSSAVIESLTQETSDLEQEVANLRHLQDQPLDDAATIRALREDLTRVELERDEARARLFVLSREVDDARSASRRGERPSETWAQLDSLVPPEGEADRLREALSAVERERDDLKAAVTIWEESHTRLAQERTAAVVERDEAREALQAARKDAEQAWKEREFAMEAVVSLKAAIGFAGAGSEAATPELLTQLAASTDPLTRAAYRALIAEAREGVMAKVALTGVRDDRSKRETMLQAEVDQWRANHEETTNERERLQVEHAAAISDRDRARRLADDTWRLAEERRAEIVDRAAVEQNLRAQLILLREDRRREVSDLRQHLDAKSATIERLVDALRPFCAAQMDNEGRLLSSVAAGIEVRDLIAAADAVKATELPGRWVRAEDHAAQVEQLRQRIGALEARNATLTSDKTVLDDVIRDLLGEVAPTKDPDSAEVAE